MLKLLTLKDFKYAVLFDTCKLYWMFYNIKEKGTDVVPKN